MGCRRALGQPPCQDLDYLAEAWARDAAVGQLQRRAGSRELGKLEAGPVWVGLLITEDRGVEHEGVPPPPSIGGNRAAAAGLLGRIAKRPPLMLVTGSASPER